MERINEDVPDDKDEIVFVAGKRSTPEWRGRLEASLGVPIKIVSDEEAEEASFVICVLRDQHPKHFDDDIVTTCAECGVSIRHRPTSPKKPKKICVTCARIEMGLHKE